VCYNCGKNGHFIAQCPYERKDEDNEKNKKKYKSYKKDKKFTKKKSYGQAHVSQEWNSSDEGSESESDDLATIAIKGESSSSKSLFPKLSKHTCLMEKEGKKKVKYNTPSSPMYVTSDEDTLSHDDNDDDASNDGDSLPSEFYKNLKAMIKGIMKHVRVRDELLEQQEKLLIQERKSNEELKKIIALGKSKVEKLDQELAQSKETTSCLKSLIGALQGQHDVLQKTHQDLEVNLMLFSQATLIHQMISKLPKPLQAKGVKDVIILILMLFVLKANIPMFTKCL
jgi:hypothetical protein